MLSQNKLDVIAWYVYIRSGFLESFEHDTFETSKWARTVIYEITKVFISDKYNLIETDNERYGFYKEIKNIIDSENYEKLSEKIIFYFNAEEKNITEYTPKEFSFALELYKNNGKFCNYINVEDGQLGFCTYKDLLDAGVDISIVKELLREYIYLDESIYAGVSGDGSSIVMKEMAAALESFGEILYSESAFVTEAGKRQWVRLQYAHESHWNEHKISNYMHHAVHGVRIPGSSVGVFFFKKRDRFNNIRTLKEDVRNILGSCATFKTNRINPHIHFPDTHREVKWIANAILNENSIKWMNNAPESYPKNWSIIFPEYKIEMDLRNDSMNFCLDTGAVMALSGIRDTSDIDYISIGVTEKPIVNERLESHNSQYIGHNIPLREIIENPRFHFIYKNIKSSTLKNVQSFKSYRSTLNKESVNSKKDETDVLLIKEFMAQKNNLILKKEIKSTENNFQNNKLYKKRKLFTKKHFISQDMFILLVKSVKMMTPKVSHKVIKKIYYKIVLPPMALFKKDKVVPRKRNILG